MPLHPNSEPQNTTSFAIAQDALLRRWKPVSAKGKIPTAKGWPTLDINSENVASHFRDPTLNVGVQLGAASGGLTDVDLDSQEAIAVAAQLLPATSCKFGRASKPRSHRFYCTSLYESHPVAALQFKDPVAKGKDAEAMLVEVRIGGGDKGAMTIIPGSIHPSGERYEFEPGCDGDPSPVHGEDLIRLVSHVSAAAVLVRYWPAHGARHDARLALGGLLAVRMSEEEAQQFGKAVAEAVGDEDEADMHAAIKGSYANVAQGKPIKSLTAAREVFGPKVANKIAVWLSDDRDPSFNGNVSRRMFPAPSRDSELTPVMRLLDEALVTDEAEPPMRDLDGRPIQVKFREPSGLHELTSDSANNEEEDNSRLPPSPTYMFERLDGIGMSIFIEKYVRFFKTDDEGNRRDVRLDPVFVLAYIYYRDSLVPKADKLMTLPIVLPDGSLLAAEGLNQKLNIVFRIDDGVRKLLPAGEIRDSEVIKAMNFLTENWLCDVQTDYAGKCVLIALGLTVLERALLDDRPVFMVTAGKRGGGKSTVFNMLSTALTGKRAAAAAWSPNEEERRKAIFAMLLQSAPLVVFDNIPLGSLISCPTIEKVCTANYLEDRVLGHSRFAQASCATIIGFTGNNIGPKGDLSSRSLIVRLSVDRPDPENREFRHPEPMKWTRDHRGGILAALYTILLGSPRNRGQAKTRFKAWWRLVGSPIEHAAALCQPNVPLDFNKIFAEVEERDEDEVTIAELLNALRDEWGGKKFQASHVYDFLESSVGGVQDFKDRRSLLAFFAEDKAELSPKSICAKLRKIVGAPVFVDEGVVMQLRESQDHRRSWWFRVG